MFISFQTFKPFKLASVFHSIHEFQPFQTFKSFQSFKSRTLMTGHFSVQMIVMSFCGSSPARFRQLTSALTWT